jgi:hypothetical protein
VTLKPSGLCFLRLGVEHCLVLVGQAVLLFRWLIKVGINPVGLLDPHVASFLFNLKERVLNLAHEVCPLASWVPGGMGSVEDLQEWLLVENRGP